MLNITRETTTNCTASVSTEWSQRQCLDSLHQCIFFQWLTKIKTELRFSFQWLLWWINLHCLGNSFLERVSLANNVIRLVFLLLVWKCNFFSYCFCRSQTHKHLNMALMYLLLSLHVWILLSEPQPTCPACNVERVINTSSYLHCTHLNMLNSLSHGEIIQQMTHTKCHCNLTFADCMDIKIIASTVDDNFHQQRDFIKHNSCFFT